MCRTADRIERQYRREAAQFLAYGYENAAERKLWDMETAIRKHKMNCLACRCEVSVMQEAIRQGRVK